MRLIRRSLLPFFLEDILDSYVTLPALSGFRSLRRSLRLRDSRPSETEVR